MTLGPSDYERAREIAGEALELPEVERSAFVHAACRGEDELETYVFDVIAASLDAGTDFATPAPALSDPHSPAEGSPLRAAMGARGFTVLEEIGDGSMGVVFRARQEALHRDVAIKVMRSSVAERPLGRERFYREVRATAGLDHPGIVRIYTDGGDDEQLWFAMEFVPGHSLAKELRLHRMQPSDGAQLSLPGLSTPDRPNVAAVCVRELADALAHAHARGIIHRDVKPSNVLIGASGSPKLVDFGVAKHVDEETLTGTDQIVGSLPYMSPEQAHVQGAVIDDRADVYSLGAVFYEMLTLQRPFPSETTHELLQKIRLEEPIAIKSLNGDVPRDLAVICQTAMAKEPRHRYASAAAMRDDLARFVGGQPIMAKPGSMGRKVRRFWARRNRVVIAAALVLLALGAGWWTRMALRPEAPSASVRVLAGGDLGVAFLRIDPMTSMPVGKEPTPCPAGAEIELKPGFGRFVARDRDGVIVHALYRELRADSPTIVRLPSIQPVKGAAIRAATPAAPPEGMVYIAPGRLQVAEPTFSALAGVAIDVPAFYLDECEVSVGDYKVFLAAHPDVEPPLEWLELGADRFPDDRPMTMVGWTAARSYAEWLGKRLPTYAEWMWAAGGPDQSRYPWGTDELREGAFNRTTFKARYPEDRLRLLLEFAAPVRSFESAMTSSGLYHMLGNAFELTETPMINAQAEFPRVTSGSAVFCGCHWGTPEDGLSLQVPGSTPIMGSERKVTLGFRCARDV